jgi:hypothetical protein
MEGREEGESQGVADPPKYVEVTDHESKSRTIITLSTAMSLHILPNKLSYLRPIW